MIKKIICIFVFFFISMHVYSLKYFLYSSKNVIRNMRKKSLSNSTEKFLQKFSEGLLEKFGKF